MILKLCRFNGSVDINDKQAIALMRTCSRFQEKEAAPLYMIECVNCLVIKRTGACYCKIEEVKR